MIWSSFSSFFLIVLIHLLILLQLPWPTPAQCQTATHSECRRQQGFVPGWELAGEGIDVTTLRRTGYFPVNAQKSEHPDGTCTLCHNNLQEGQLQRLPLAITDWRSYGGAKCKRNVVKREASSAVEVAAEVAKKIQNDWKADLEVQPKPDSSGKISMAASHSEAAEFASGKTHQDEYSFAIESVQCGYYRYRLVRKPPLNQEFLQAVRALPHEFNTSTSADYRQFITNYGTHFLKSVELGGQATDITALQTCKLALDGLKANDVNNCLEVEAAVSVGNTAAKSEIKKCEDKKKKHNIKGSFHSTYTERNVEVEGGDLNGGSSDLLFSDEEGAGKFSEWMSTLPSKPGLLTYTLEPLHFLLGSKNPWKKELRKAVSHYVSSRARWQDCSKPCPPGQKKDPRDPCHCVCEASTFTNSDCCPREKGLAHMEVTNLSAKNLWGDYTTATDAYIKALFGNKKLWTHVIWNNNNPTWNMKLDFGTVQLMTGTPLTIQVWDKDRGWNDNLLGSCDHQPVAGGWWEHCQFKHGSLRFHYRVTCAPHLTGEKCEDYAPRGALREPVRNQSGAVW